MPDPSPMPNDQIDDIAPPTPAPSVPGDKDHVEDLIDEGSAESFPASDPPASHQFT